AEITKGRPERGAERAAGLARRRARGADRRERGGQEGPCPGAQLGAIRGGAAVEGEGVDDLIVDLGDEREHRRRPAHRLGPAAAARGVRGRGGGPERGAEQRARGGDALVRVCGRDRRAEVGEVTVTGGEESRREVAWGKLHRGRRIAGSPGDGQQDRLSVWRS